jgi:polyisoprenoid-binding protein YceI
LKLGIVLIKFFLTLEEMMKILMLALTFVLSSAFADWQLVNDQSDLNFMSIKQDFVAEIHRFKRLAGKVDAEGNVVITIDVNSLDTGVAIRDSRMHEWLFATARYPEIRLSGQIPLEKMQEIKELSLGESLQLPLTATLALVGKEQPLTVSLRITAVEKGLLVTTMQPVVLLANRFDLTAGVEKLRELAALKMISLAVPVTFSLFFAPLS